MTEGRDRSGELDTGGGMQSYSQRETESKQGWGPEWELYHSFPGSVKIANSRTPGSPIIPCYVYKGYQFEGMQSMNKTAPEPTGALSPGVGLSFDDGIVPG